MKAFINAPGDRSVGIFPCQIVIDFKGVEIERQSTRMELTECFKEILDDNVYVFFDDECSDCLKINGHKNSCPQKELS